MLPALMLLLLFLTMLLLLLRMLCTIPLISLSWNSLVPVTGVMLALTAEGVKGAITGVVVVVVVVVVVIVSVAVASV
jgi:hypothetical protein